jgi:hypothetical protein
MNVNQDLEKITVWREYQVNGLVFYVSELPSGYLVRDEDAVIFYFVKANSHREAVLKVLECEYGEVSEVKYTGAWDVVNASYVPEEEVVE